MSCDAMTVDVYSTEEQQVPTGWCYSSYSESVDGSGLANIFRTRHFTIRKFFLVRSLSRFISSWQLFGGVHEIKSLRELTTQSRRTKNFRSSWNWSCVEWNVGESHAAKFSGEASYLCPTKITSFYWYYFPNLMLCKFKKCHTNIIVWCKTLCFIV